MSHSLTKAACCQNGKLRVYWKKVASHLAAEIAVHFGNSMFYCSACNKWLYFDFDIEHVINSVFPDFAFCLKFVYS